MITYNDIYEAARKERYSDRLQLIAQNFVSEVSIYLKEKKETSNREDDVFSDIVIKAKKQLENAVTLFRELMLRRRKKILNLVLIAAETGISRQDFENMLNFEKELFEDIMKCVENSDKKVNDLLSGSGDDGTLNNELVLFIEDVPSFSLENGDEVGPFTKGDVANLSKEIVNMLISDSKCEKVLD